MINSLITSEFFFAQKITLVVSFPDNPDPVSGDIIEEFPQQ